MKWFSLQIELASHQALINPIYKLHPEVNHLIYADDSFVVFKANLLSLKTIEEIFKQMETLAGLKVNELKTKRYMNKSCKNRA